MSIVWIPKDAKSTSWLHNFCKHHGNSMACDNVTRQRERECVWRCVLIWP